MNNKLLVIAGPTSTGKTDLAIFLARKFNGELVSCDSRQVYKNLDIGTGKMPSQKLTERLQIIKGNGFWEISGIKVWMYDAADVEQRYTVFDYKNDSGIVIQDIFKRNKLPIIVGGTGLYMKLLLEDGANLKVPIDKKLRSSLSTLSLVQLQNKLKKLSFKKWSELNNSDRNNPRRLLRSIEIVSMNPYVKRIENKGLRIKDYEVLKIGLIAPIGYLRKKINLHLKTRLQQGMIKEAKDLHENGLTLVRMKELGLEYGLLSEFLAGEINQDQLVQKLQFKIGQYAKRQLTWFKKEKNINWFDVTNQNLYEKVVKKVQIWYDQP